MFFQAFQILGSVFDEIPINFSVVLGVEGGAQEGGMQPGRVGVPRELTIFPAFLHDEIQRFQHPDFIVFNHFKDVLIFMLTLFGLDDAEKITQSGHPVHIHLDEGHNFLPGGSALVLHHLTAEAEPFRHPVAENGLQQRLFGTEIIRNHRNVHPGRGGNHAGAGAVIAMLGNQFFGGVEDVDLLGFLRHNKIFFGDKTSKYQSKINRLIEY